MNDLFGPIEPTHYISLSGGLGSGVSALAAHHYGIPFRMIFADTLVEDGDLYRFNRDIAEAVGQPIVTRVDGRTPYEVFVDRKFIGNSRTAHCSDILKTLQVRKWLAENNIPITDPLVLGMDWFEQDRIERAIINWKPRPVVSLLNRFKIARKDHAAWLKRYGIDQPRLYDQGFPHNNCGGGCVRAGLKQWATLLERNPKRFAVHEKSLNDAMAKIGPTAKPFLKRTVKGEAEYMTLTTFRQYVEAGTIEIDPYDFGGCACFVDENPEIAA
ncbi:putative PAPS reductase protein [Rhizobium phage RHph_Y52]|nr:putative PAPS reductase protein [Rhizobium phage RHph_Y21]QIG76705.1 putative PAPS reductase protein [Rhizobium phage RHph_Y52]